jgi:hypothetical protein
MRRSIWVAASLAMLSAGCNCGHAPIVTVDDAGHPYERLIPASGLASGAVDAHSKSFHLVGEVNSPAGVSARSTNYVLKAGTVEASQE